MTMAVAVAYGFWNAETAGVAEMISSEVLHRRGIAVDWDVAIPMADGLVLRGDVFRPAAPGRVPGILAYGPYGKWLHFADGFPLPWSLATEGRPDVLDGSSNEFQSFEVVDPEKFVPDGYAVIRVDSRGMGRSPGFVDPWSMREARDICECIEWCALQSWCSGRVGLSGTSYLAMNQWQAAALEPPSLAAIRVWEGASDIYREMVRHGGILSTFGKVWFEAAIIAIQHGKGRHGYRSRATGGLVSGPETLPDEVLEANRVDWHAECRAHRLVTAEFWRSRIPDLSRIRVPLLSTANWGGQGLHLRGNFEGFLNAASGQRWLDVHCMKHWLEYYTAYGVELQKQFFGFFLKGEQNGWRERPPVHICVRSVGPEYMWRHEAEWPLARTTWTRMYLDTAALGRRPGRPRPKLGGISRFGSRRHVPGATSRVRHGVHRAAVRETLRVFLDLRRRSVRRPAGIGARPGGAYFSRTRRPPHSAGAGLASGIASQARSRPQPSVPAVSRA